jgi:uncharacterized OB-fold protein
MDDQNYSLPELDWPLLAPFWQACQNEELKFPYCTHCHQWQWYPIYNCPDCGGELNWVKVSRKGTLYSWTVVYKPFFPEFADKVPFIVGVADIDDAPGVRLIANIIDCKADDLQVGMKLDVVFDHVNDKVSLPKFKLSNTK